MYQLINMKYNRFIIIIKYVMIDNTLIIYNYFTKKDFIQINMEFFITRVIVLLEDIIDPNFSDLVSCIFGYSLV